MVSGLYSPENEEDNEMAERKLAIKIQSIEKNKFGSIDVFDIKGNKYQTKDENFLQEKDPGKYVNVIITDRTLKNKTTGEPFTLREVRYDKEEADSKVATDLSDETGAKSSSRYGPDQKLSALQTAFKGACGIFEGHGIVAVPKVFALASTIYGAMTGEEIDWYDYGKKILMVTIPDAKIIGTAQGVFNSMLAEPVVEKITEESQLDIDRDVEALDALVKEPESLIEDDSVEGQERERVSKEAIDKIKEASPGSEIMPQYVESWMEFYVQAQKWFKLVKPGMYFKVWGLVEKEWVAAKEQAKLTPQQAWEQVQSWNEAQDEQRDSAK